MAPHPIRIDDAASALLPLITDRSSGSVFHSHEREELDTIHPHRSRRQHSSSMVSDESLVADPVGPGATLGAATHWKWGRSRFNVSMRPS